MISFIIDDDVISHHDDGFRCRREYNGLSTDEKPTEDVKNADIFYEMDTQKVWLFDEENQTWIEQ